MFNETDDQTDTIYYSWLNRLFQKLRHLDTPVIKHDSIKFE